MPKILLIDNFDSFVFNLAQYLGALGAEPVVVRNDVSISEIEQVAADAIVISPGPGRPEDSGCSPEVISQFAGRLPILGVCLGHQAIGIAYGAQVVRAGQVMHGKVSEIHHNSRGVFVGLPDPFPATRYHSLVIDPRSMPGVLEVTATTPDGVVMGVKHKVLPVEGVQFHPESVLTPAGMALMENFLTGVRNSAGDAAPIKR
ncbi:MAG: anthranilate synthase component II [Actinomycetota bacterium]